MSRRTQSRELTEQQLARHRRALELARRDPRQVSLFGDGHTQELLEAAKNPHLNSEVDGDGRVLDQQKTVPCTGD
jgi:hypothetical protein